MTDTAADRRFMALALSLGRRGLGRVAPNPSVGCVIVNDGRIVGRGRTADGGRPHAEVAALAQAGQRAAGATAYVTLEPCAHHGQTPPCAEALIAAGIARVVVAAGDPDARVAGKGIALLRGAGIAVELGVMEAAARRDHAGFLMRVTQNRPFLTLKLALTIDGRIATAKGDSQWITGPAARRRVHLMRARHDAVMVGAGTLRADDPMLNVRGLGDVPQPVRVVVSTALDVPRQGRLLDSAADQPVWLCHGPDGATDGWGAAKLIACETGPDEVDPLSVLSNLADRGITRVFCEGGGALAASLLKAGVVDKLVVFTGGAVIGGDGLPGTGPIGLDRLADAPRFTLARSEPVGGDMMQVWRPAAGESSGSGQSSHVETPPSS